MLRILFIAVVFSGVAAVVHADVYRWVDAQGGIHYSDEWVPGSQLIKLDRRQKAADVPTAHPTSEQNKLAVKSDRISAELSQQNTQQAVQQDVSQAKDQQCKDAKDRYQKAIESRRIYKMGTDGERQYMSDAEIDQYRLQARTDMQTACGSDSK